MLSKIPLFPIVRGFSNNQKCKATLYFTGFSITYLNITNNKANKVYQLCHKPYSFLVVDLSHTFGAGASFFGTHGGPAPMSLLFLVQSIIHLQWIN